jgi:sphingolipid delta-4 desaturase
MAKYETFHVDYPEPHFARTQEILKNHPEVKKLFGNTPSTAWIVFGTVALQVGIAIQLGHTSWGWILLVAYTVGAFANHALWVMIHECTHNLVFKTTPANSLLSIISNIPIIFPSAMSFRIFHIKHHLYQGEWDRDADLPRSYEISFAGNSSIRKALWYLGYFLPQMLRVKHMKGIDIFTRWIALNFVVEIAFIVALVHFTGWGGLLYLTLSTIFSIGLHPVGARWIQEHYVVHEKQETYSYYGPLNTLAFNVGYHNEHHDLMRVPWSRLPKVRAAAPEIYNNLFYHTSWTKLMLWFIFDRNLGLFSRVTRPPSANVQSVAKSVSARPAKVEMQAPLMI